MDITINICKTHGNNCDGVALIKEQWNDKSMGTYRWLFLHVNFWLSLRNKSF